MYRPGPTKESLAEMAAAGLIEDDFSDDAVEIWPENWAAYMLFAYMRTQWRAGGLGVIGLDYGPLHRKMDRLGLTDEEYDNLEADVQVMEFAALAEMNDRGE